MTQATTIQLLTLSLIAVIALNAATVAGFMTWQDTGRVRPTLRQAAVAFGGASALGLAVWEALSPR